MGAISSGTLLYRRDKEKLEVLIVRPSGPAARYGWSIPKGLQNAKESLEEAARRETREETGIEPGKLEPLGFTGYKKSRKKIHCFVGPAPDSEPKVATWEIDRAQYVSLDEAHKL